MSPWQNTPWAQNGGSEGDKLGCCGYAIDRIQKISPQSLLTLHWQTHMEFFLCQIFWNLIFFSPWFFFFVLLLAVVYKTIFSITFLFKLYNLKTFRSVAAIFYYWEVKLEQVKLFSARFWHHLWSIGLAGQSLSVETWVSCMYAAMFGNQGTVSHSVRFSHILKWNL